MITAQDVREPLAQGWLSDRVTRYATRDLIVCHPDDSLQEVLLPFDIRDIGHLPVVPREDPTRMLGIISRLQAIRAYNRALRERRGPGAGSA